MRAREALVLAEEARAGRDRRGRCGPACVYGSVWVDVDVNDVVLSWCGDHTLIDWE